jgi:HSP90 family molecular chaperone
VHPKDVGSEPDHTDRPMTDEQCALSIHQAIWAPPTPEEIFRNPNERQRKAHHQAARTKEPRPSIIFPPSTMTVSKRLGAVATRARALANGRRLSSNKTISTQTFHMSGIRSAASTIDAHRACFSSASGGGDGAPSTGSSGKKKTMEFQAETKQLLDIVTNSLYTDKEVFLRELISNASDALEKLRHLQTTGADMIDGDKNLEIKITLDEVESSITIQDSGIGMTQDEIISNLGTIARSGSKNFIAELQKSANSDGLDIARGIIGKFGVGFYSVFMVAKEVQVTTQPATGGPATVWTSDGTGTYELSELDDEEVRQDRGTTIKIFLDSDYWHLLSEPKIEEILKKYSNFVQFPILLNGKRVNTVQAVWGMDPKEVEYETYVEFYKYIAQAVDDPLDILHFRADAPLEIKALLFIPSFHSEKYGMDRMEPGVSLYSRKVMIESKSPDIVPDWMRFVKGVVDSEDLPLAISREKPQDSALIRKLRKALTGKFLSQLEKMAKYVNLELVSFRHTADGRTHIVALLIVV